MTDVCPEVLKFKSNAAPGSFLARDNIATFIKYASARNSGSSVLFETDDLVSVGLYAGCDVLTYAHAGQESEERVVLVCFCCQIISIVCLLNSLMDVARNAKGLVKVPKVRMMD